MRDLTKEERDFFENLLEKKPMKHQGYWIYRVHEGRYSTYKNSRIVMQLHLGKKLEVWELVHHKDGDRSNDSIENLEVLNASEHSHKHFKEMRGAKRPEGWKPANTLKKEVVDRIYEISDGMVRVNCSEVSRRLEKEDIQVTSATIKRYLNNRNI